MDCRTFSYSTLFLWNNLLTSVTVDAFELELIYCLNVDLPAYSLIIPVTVISLAASYLFSIFVPLMELL